MPAHFLAGIAGPQPAGLAIHIEPRQVPLRITRADHGVQHHTGLVAKGHGQIQPRQHVGQRAIGQYAAGIHQHQVVGQPRHFVDGMADVDDGDAQFFVQPVQIGQDLGLATRVQRGQGLIHQQQCRAGGQRACDGHALALAARKRIGPALQQVGDAQQVHDLVQRDAALVAGDALEAVREVVLHVQVRKQGRLLDHVADGALMRGHEEALRVVLPDRIAKSHTARGAFQAGQGPQHRGLAAARGPEQGGHAVCGQAQRHVQREATARQAQLRFDHGALTSGSRAGRLTTYSVTSTTKANTTMPAARRWASANSLASTWS